MTQDRTNWAPFVNWGPYKSSDANNPDILEMKITDIETFETMYSTNVKAQLKQDDKFHDVVILLKSNTSNNVSLQNQWSTYEEGIIKPGIKFKLKTWLGKSLTTGRTIRRFVFEFESRSP